MNDVLDELELMSNSIAGVGDEQKTDPPSTDQPATDPPADFEAKTDAPATDPPEDEVETDPPETDSVATDPPDDRDETIADLRRQLAEKDEHVKTDPPSTDAPYEEQDFIGDLDFDEIRDEPGRFNTVLNEIYRKAVTDTTSNLNKQFSEQVPRMIEAVNAMKQTADNFYEQNPDLAPFKKAVATVFNEVAGANPNKSYEDLMADTEVEARKRLGLKKSEGGKPKKRTGKKPRLPRKKGGPGKPKGDDNKDPLQKELEEMNETLGR